jgi:hypothetical protein
MLPADMVVNAIDAALKNGEVTFNRVGVDVATNVLADALIDCTMIREFRSDSCSAFIAIDLRGRMDLLLQDRPERLGIHNSPFRGREKRPMRFSLPGRR